MANEHVLYPSILSSSTSICPCHQACLPTSPQCLFLDGPLSFTFQGSRLSVNQWVLFGGIWRPWSYILLDLVHILLFNIVFLLVFICTVYMRNMCCCAILCHPLFHLHFLPVSDIWILLLYVLSKIFLHFRSFNKLHQLRSFI